MTQKIILVIEDQKAMASLLQEKISQQTDLPVYVANCLVDAKKIIESDVDVVVCLTDLNLPDAEEGASVPLLRDNHITTVVLTANYTEETRQKMFQEKVADYVIKDGMAAIDYAVKTVISLVDNASIHIWLLSPQNKNSRRLIGLLNIQRYKVSVFEDEKLLLKTMETKAPDLLILSEVKSLENVAAVDFIQTVRADYSQSQLPIMLCGDHEDMAHLIKLMKYGMNDFYNLNFTAEEFYVRLSQNISQALSYKKIERISQTDALTGLYNRRYFFEKGKELYDANPEEVFAVMLDIDFFKKVNDTYGHQKGDEVIILVGNTIKEIFKDYLVARFGGEEYCVVGKQSQLNDVIELCEQVRQRIEDESGPKVDVPLTISVGLSSNQASLELLISTADEALYFSKESGRNQVNTYGQYAKS